MSTPQPFRVDIPQADLDDLAGRLARTRWPDELPGAGWDSGVPSGQGPQLAAYWRQGYDWHAQAARLNAIPQFTTVIDGQQIHFLHARGGAGLPLLLCHGWPSTPADFLELIGPLAGAGFDLVIPSMPGYGFSGPTTSPGWDVARIARAYAELMARLGYGRYGAHGGDWGARIVPELARLDQQHVAGIHLHGFVAFPAGDPGELTATEQQRLGRLRRWQAERGGYAAIQGQPAADPRVRDGRLPGRAARLVPGVVRRLRRACRRDRQRSDPHQRRDLLADGHRRLSRAAV